MVENQAVCLEDSDPGEQHSNIWEFPVSDFLVCARPDLHGLFILSATARFAWELHKDGRSLGRAAEIFGTEFRISVEQAFEDVSRVWRDWSSSLLAPISTRGQAMIGESNRLATWDESGFFSCADYSVFGKAIRLRLFCADLAWDLAPRVQPFRINSPVHISDEGYAGRLVDVYPAGGTFEVFVDEVKVASEGTVFGARITVLQEFLRASGPRNWTAVLHAGACGSDSECIIFPGASHAGKTTLAAALVRSGMVFYGDDSVPLEQGSLTIQPMPFALMAREGSWPALSKLFPELDEAPTVERWGAKVRYLTVPLPLERPNPKAAGLVFTGYRDGAPTSLEGLTAFDALMRLTESGFWLEHDRASIGSFLAWFEATPHYSLAYSDLGEAVSLLRGLLHA